MRRRWLAILGVATVLLWLGFVAPPQMDSADALVRLEVARAVWMRGTIALEKPPNDPEMAPLGTDGRYYGLFPLGQSRLFIPLDVAAHVATSPLGASRAFSQNVIIAGTYFLLSNLLLAVVLFKLMRRGGLSSRSSALGLAFLFLATQWLVWGRSTQEETVVAALLGAIVLCWWRTQATAWRGMLAGLAMGFVANMRYNAAFAVAAIVLWSFFVLERGVWWRFWAAGAISLLPWLALAGIYNFARFGSPFATGYGLLVERGMMAPWQFRPAVLWELALGLDFGAVWFWPVLFLGWFATKARLALGCILLGVLGHALLLSCYSSSPGGYGCVGPRYLFHQLALALPFAWAGVRRIWNHAQGRALAICALGLSALVQWGCVILIEPIETMQQQARSRASLETFPTAYLPARAANIGRLVSGSLFEYSWPASLGEGSGKTSRLSYVTATRPNLLPWRVRGIKSSANTSAAVQWAATGAWLAVGVGAAAALAMPVKRCRKVRAT